MTNPSTINPLFLPLVPLEKRSSITVTGQAGICSIHRVLPQALSKNFFVVSITVNALARRGPSIAA